MHHNVLITGGHATPALAVIAAMPKDWQIVYVGRKSALEGDDADSAEYRWIIGRGVRFRSIVTGRLQRQIGAHALISLLKIPIGLIQAWFIVRQENPHVILSFGGYVAVPIVVVGALLRIPIVTHEQTMRPGIANRVIARFARAVCISWSQSAQYFSHNALYHTGNPIRQSIFDVGKQYPVSRGLPLLYVTGGSLGSRMINRAIEGILPQLLESFAIIHQTGAAEGEVDYRRLTAYKHTLPERQKNRYHVVVHVDEAHIGWVLAKAAVVVSRAGANTVSELIARHKPAVLIPLPHAGMDEQRAHARFLQQAGGAIVIEQHELSAQLLLTTIQTTYKKRAELHRNMKKLVSLINRSAAKEIVEIVAQQR